MTHNPLEKLRAEIVAHETNAAYLAKGYMPLFVANPAAKIIVVGQAPGIRAQSSGLAWDDASGVRLMRWLGVTQEQFRNPRLFAHVPMDFYYPGKSKTGDAPPRKDFASLWHGRIMEHLHEAQLTVLIGKYAQNYYLPTTKGRNLTDTVRDYTAYLPDFFPLVHPSPLNFRWFAKNSWFEEQLVPVLQSKVARIIS